MAEDRSDDRQIGGVLHGDELREIGLLGEVVLETQSPVAVSTMSPEQEVVGRRAKATDAKFGEKRIEGGVARAVDVHTLAWVV